MAEQIIEHYPLWPKLVKLTTERAEKKQKRFSIASALLLDGGYKYDSFYRQNNFLIQN